MLHSRQAPGRDFHKHFSLAPARSDTNPTQNVVANTTTVTMCIVVCHYDIMPRSPGPAGLLWGDNWACRGLSGCCLSFPAHAHFRARPAHYSRGPGALLGKRRRPLLVLPALAMSV